MLDNDHQPPVSLLKRRITRREMLLTTGGALAGILLVGCTGGQEQPSGPVSGEFVGIDVGSSPNDFYPLMVAIIAEKAGEDGEERDIRAYVCDGQDITEWYWGTATGNTIDLTSETGEAQLQAELMQDEASGTFTLSGSEPIDFITNRATRAAGLYDVVITPDGAISGVSWGGNVLAAQIIPRDATDGSGRTSVVEGTITLPDGATIDYLESHEGVSQTAEGTWEPSGEYRYIMTPSGGGHGARKTSRTGSSFGIIGLDKAC